MNILIFYFIALTPFIYSTGRFVYDGFKWTNFAGSIHLGPWTYSTDATDQMLISIHAFFAIIWVTCVFYLVNTKGKRYHAYVGYLYTFTMVVGVIAGAQQLFKKSTVVRSCWSLGEFPDFVIHYSSLPIMALFIVSFANLIIAIWQIRYNHSVVNHKKSVILSLIAASSPGVMRLILWVLWYVNGKGHFNVGESVFFKELAFSLASFIFIPGVLPKFNPAAEFFFSNDGQVSSGTVQKKSSEVNPTPIPLLIKCCFALSAPFTLLLIIVSIMRIVLFYTFIGKDVESCLTSV